MKYEKKNHLYLKMASSNLSTMYHQQNFPIIRNIFHPKLMNSKTMEAKSSALVVLLLTLFSSFSFSFSAGINQPTPGRWELLRENAGVSAMHMALLPDGKVIIFDRTDAGPSNISFPGSKCVRRLVNSTYTDDCFAHSIEFNPTDGGVRPLTLRTETWCSSGSLTPDGMLIQNGGSFQGSKASRNFRPWANGDWEENLGGLLVPRWYASNLMLPNGKIIVVGGSDQFSYEFVPKMSESDTKLYQLPFLEETRQDQYFPNNLYPFIHIAPDGNLFMFANSRGILLDYVNNKVIRNYPELPPGGISRNYPSTGSSTLLPITLPSDTNTTPEAEVLICGGTTRDSGPKAFQGTYLPATKTCGRIEITSGNPTWEMEEMPYRRILGDMILLPTGDVLIINGAKTGAAGWDMARQPLLSPILYRPNLNSSRFLLLASNSIPRMYHSSALLLPDGRVLVGGSNAHQYYNFTALYPTDLTLQAFHPPYLDPTRHRPIIKGINPVQMKYKQRVSVRFVLKDQDGVLHKDRFFLTLVAPTFTTHSFSMNQRLLVLVYNSVQKVGRRSYVVDVNSPPSSALAPPGYYLLHVVHDGLPTRGTWVRIL